MSAFPNGIVGVQTDVPVFIGYTQQAQDPISHKSLCQRPISIASLADYQAFFGQGFRPTFQLTPASQGDYDIAAPGPEFFKLVQTPDTAFHLYNAVRLFFANGGGSCDVVSCGQYHGGPIRLADLQAGLEASAQALGPSMVVIPDACLLPPDAYATLVAATLKQCAALQDRVAILDLCGCTDPANWSPASIQAQADAFYAAVGDCAGAYSYGAAYFPALKTSVVAAEEVDFPCLDLLTPGSATAALRAEIEQVILDRLNVCPASGAMAGIWARNDQSDGVWNAPSDMALNQVTALAVTLTDADQEPLNTPINGLAINAIRDFPNRGPMVWGARTLDGNSNDYRYIQVRRTLIYIEQSIKAGLQSHVFAANDATTWTGVTSEITSFLTGLWTQGGLMGATASDAFAVQCGLGSTMTAQDILDGYMVVSVALQMIHPGEFIALTFKQLMPAGS
ncbi:MAG: phage tail sheath family protein [Betaproteobacteria bacterium]|nr:phage tail sheath family protein [Betaproteobacteria bacterium]